MGVNQFKAAAGALAGLLFCMTAGCTSNRDWRRQADEGIERYRKRDAQVTVVDAAGKPMAGVKVDIRQTRKAFPFGAAISGAMLRNARWQEEFKKHFNYAVFENEAKWYSNENGQRRINYTQADQLLAWCDANDIPVRGHCLFWEKDPGPPAWLKSLSDDQVRQAIEGRMTSAATHFKGRFQSWDVNNEMLHGTFFVDKLGKDIRVWMYQQARKIDPSAKLFTNEYNILSVDWQYADVDTDKYVALVRELMRSGAPIDGVGIQGHIWKEDILGHPEVIRQRLDKVAALGLPIWISEFDVAGADEKERADKLEVVYRMAYSHPAVQGIMMWTFWEGNSWRDDKSAAYYQGPAHLMNRDWTANEEGRRFEQLLAEWNTSGQIVTDAEGQARFRGFYGTYAVRIDRPGQLPVEETVMLAPGSGVDRIRLIAR